MSFFKTQKIIFYLISTCLISNVLSWFEMFDEDYEATKEVKLPVVEPKRIGVLETINKNTDFKQLTDRNTTNDTSIYLMFQKCYNTSESFTVRLSHGNNTIDKYEINDFFKLVEFKKDSNPYLLSIPNSSLNNSFEEDEFNQQIFGEKVSFAYDILDKKPNISIQEIIENLREFKGSVNLTKKEIKRAYFKWNKLPDYFHVKEYHFYIIRADQDDARHAEDYCYLENQLYKKKEKDRFNFKNTSGENTEDNFFTHRGDYEVACVAIVDKPFYFAVAYPKIKIKIGIETYKIVLVTAAVVIGNLSISIGIMNLYHHFIGKKEQNKVKEEDVDGSLYSEADGTDKDQVVPANPADKDIPWPNENDIANEKMKLK